uniref:Uncharacterized protein n=1 Tax=Schistosoma haematobium TaxID=6185 RepID=A0A094ZFN3_SCHHA
MVDSSIFDEIPEEISAQLVSFSEATDDIEQLVKKISNFSNDSNTEDRVMNALKRCRSLVEREGSARLKLDKEATTRFVKHALWKSAHTKTKKRRMDSSS